MEKHSKLLKVVLIISAIVFIAVAVVMVMRNVPYGIASVILVTGINLIAVTLLFVATSRARKWAVWVCRILFVVWLGFSVVQSFASANEDAIFLAAIYAVAGILILLLCRPNSKEIESLNTFLSVSLNLTWGIFQNLFGLVFFLINIKKPHFWYKGSIVTTRFGPQKDIRRQGGTSFGMFIFITTDYTFEQVQNSQLVAHEYGHTLQSAVVGPFQVLVGIASLIWGVAFHNYRERTNTPYERFFIESWANRWGAVSSHDDITNEIRAYIIEKDPSVLDEINKLPSD